MIAILKSVVGVFIGYAIFVAGTLTIFQMTGQAAHAEASVLFMILSTVVGCAFSLAGGYVAGLIAGRKPLAHGIAVAIVLAAGAGASLASTLGNGSIWSQTAALLFMAPSAALGGWIRARK